MAGWTTHKHVPTHLRRQCLARDGNQCTALMLNGTRCPETRTPHLEAHHIHGYQPGEHLTLDMLTTLCKWHHNKITQQQAADGRRRNAPPQRRRKAQHPGLL